MTNAFRSKINSIFVLLFFISGVFSVWWLIRDGKDVTDRASFEGETFLKAGKDFSLADEGKQINNLQDGDMLHVFPRLQAGFESLDFSLHAETALAQENQTVTKVTRTNVLQTGKKQDLRTVSSSYAINDITITTDYQESKNYSLDGFSPVKQTITLKNDTGKERTIDFSNRIHITSDTVEWDGSVYAITPEPQIFKAYEKTSAIPDIATDREGTAPDGIEAFARYTHTYQTGSTLTFTVDGHLARYDWTDSLMFEPEISVYREGEDNIIEFVAKSVTVPANGAVVIDPNFGLNDTSAYDIRYDGSTALPGLTESVDGGQPNIITGDVNGDGVKDLVIGAPNADYNGIDSGSAFVIFGGSGIAVGDKPLDIATHYNIRYDGGAANDNLTAYGALHIGDVNGDALPDLVLGALGADNKGTDSGSTWVIFGNSGITTVPDYYFRGPSTLQGPASFQ